jgi:tripartite-type tricarboxylate transporter receptor subunit TctC
MREAGYPGVEMLLWFGLVGPAGIDAQIVKKLNDAFVKAEQDPEIQQKLSQQGFTVRPSAPDELREQIKAERSTMAEMIQQAGAKAQ